jgi:hypothetical protein
MQLFQKVDFYYGLLCWLFGIEDLDAIPLFSTLDVLHKD